LHFLIYLFQLDGRYRGFRIPSYSKEVFLS
jgi:hypothetical protein